MVSFVIRCASRLVLGPLFFNLFINDLFYIIKTDICNYADDTTPYAVDMCLEGLMAKLECAANSAMEWFNYNGMKLNSSKCHLLVCGHKFESMILKIDNTMVIETHLVKLLGMRIDSDLTFCKQINFMYKKASQKLNALSRLCYLMSFHKRKMLMNAFFNSQFTYCPLVWMFCGRQINSKIDNLHHRALRMVYRDNTSSFEELLKKDGSVKIHHSSLQSLAIEIFKVKLGTAPNFMGEIFTLNENNSNVSSNTRPRSKSTFYNQNNPKTVKYGLETLRCLGPKIWDMIPLTIKNSPSLPEFKNKIKKWVPQNCPCRLCKVYIPQLGFL